MSAWINPTAHLAGTYGPTVIANTDGDGWALRINNGQIMADLRLTGGNILQQFGAQLPLNGWSYVSYSYDGTKVTAFVNGVQVGTAAASGSIKTASNKSTCTFIGNDPSGCVAQGT